jgi:hypothetical protein
MDAPSIQAQEYGEKQISAWLDDHMCPFTDATIYRISSLYQKPKYPFLIHGKNRKYPLELNMITFYRASKEASVYQTADEPRKTVRPHLKPFFGDSESFALKTDTNISKRPRIEQSSVFIQVLKHTAWIKDFPSQQTSHNVRSLT